MVTLLSQVDAWFLHIVVVVLALYAGYTLKHAASKIEKVIEKMISMDKRLTVVEFACPKIHKYEETHCKEE